MTETSNLEIETISLDQAAELREPLIHLRDVHGCAPAMLAARLFSMGGPLTVLVVPEHEDALQELDDLRTFCPSQRIEYLPAPESHPYDSVRPDRAIAMTRASCLFKLDTDQVDVLVTTAGGWIRRVMPADILAKATISLELGDAAELSQLSVTLEHCGYQRVPIAEDPGTFAIRGDIVDLWPAGFAHPVRLEFEFDKLSQIREYDGETQRTRNALTLTSISCGPARESFVTAAASERASQIVRKLCDDASLPSSQTRGLIEDVTQGRLFLGALGFLPAYAPLSTLRQRIPAGSHVLFRNAARIIELIDRELETVETSFQQLVQTPAFAPHEHYVTAEQLDSTLDGVHCVSLHGAAISGDEQSGFARLKVPPLACPSLDTRPQDELTQRLVGARHADGKTASLAPLAHQIQRWQEEGLTVVLCARVATGVDRLKSLLEHRGLVTSSVPLSLFSPRPGTLHIVSLPLARGVVAPHAGLALLTDEEIFGKRVHRTTRKAKGAIQGALDDLRTLTPGDHVVHSEHGIGRYCGLEHKQVGGHAVDLLVVEYHGGDRLLLPVYRLNQVQKFSGEGSPKLDRLGGQTFAKTKSSVRKKVRIIADQLLRLYAERQTIRREPLSPPGDEFAAFEAAFPYEETPDQADAIQDVISDLQKDTVMDRLVCGDVGFGKTEVALRATFLAAHAGRQVAVLCPTTVLAQQHLRTFQQRLEDTGIEIRGMSRFQSKKAQTETLAGMKTGAVDVVVGTHRLLSKDVHFKSLGLLVVDEEQRFGVTHKERLKDLRKTVDVLTLTATPIPRTLSLAVGGMRDMSVITTAPEDRRSIRTFTARFGEQLLRDAVGREIARGGQVFYVYNRVEGIYERASLLRKLVPGLRVAVGHGQMSEKELEKVMIGFVQGDFDVLCATAIVESGLDISRANTIIIDRADMFGLAQLYQLRGRVGRSSERAYCYLLVPPDEKLSNESRARIEALERYTELGSGFHIATMDMEIRGAGELLGADQSGFMAKVGFELFAEMLEQATAELSGDEIVVDVDPELSIDVEALLPESYIEDIGVRLSLYKKYACAIDESDIIRLNEEISDRFGAPPLEARRFAEVMRLKTDLRRIRALGLSATSKTATLHLRADTPLSPDKLVPFIASSNGRYTLSPDGRLTRRASAAEAQADGLRHADSLLMELSALL